MKEKKPDLVEFSPDNTIFLLLSFEGPDVYSQAGGLGVRMAELSRSLAEEKYETHLFFIGDPSFPGEEKLLNNRLIYHRWCQWISHYHRGGVYDGEEGKLLNYQDSLPPWILRNIFFLPKNGKKNFVVLSEEWHTAETTIRLHRMSQSLKLKPLFLWNANNTFGFHRIQWDELKRSAAVTTVSKYMKHLMWKYQVDPLVIPNGIPKRFFAPIHKESVSLLRKSADTDLLLAKIGRFDPDKRWIMAVKSFHHLKKMGIRSKLIIRGGVEPHGWEVKNLAESLGLKIVPVKLPKNADYKLLCQFLKQTPAADIYDLQFFVSEELLRAIYKASDAVLANSRHEPFGLVGLEVMACGGVAITGNSGEDYAQSFRNAIVVETEDPLELSSYLISLYEKPTLSANLRKNGIESAKAFLWEVVIEELKRKLMYLGMERNS
ncbi:MAG: glycosyltransferase family 4 protein [Candidatus Eremiobacteraeota bacterium]|nr:glycosyltransferase family 4 protein [Candidatus Eremiobacteraeota bacterium]